ncbi:addiction module protein [Comamonas badia]|uniref:addiction module protein n=1 Tax=Comamonas badia TaxID=265291 RepID=UPI0003F61424|nr:addiction module protein [Comamonas badia]
MTAIDIAELPVAEKLMLMEKLWDALSAQAASAAVPTWHQEVLVQRLQRLDSGAEAAAPWAQARERIRTQTKAT